ncbi:DUF2138 domain-containing protein [Ralstonia sp. NFACC01]|jgi:uncharacterized protein YfaA (DUF2138 family)|uniref:DUF2138 domain-containing protein n=1 Tax=Ralstonia sp. NFACC01 TaxID=1566294 RepID=UPI0008E527F4|nr:DUF2138 domain-containing protein [Ralstonia sp. NFACC01]SFQ17155.1 Uncharacterized conserved protein YfaA, DUF2138 family [Ralstonia sp. NFACC01]
MKLTRKQIAVGAVALVVAGAAVVQMVWHPFGRTRALHARQVQLDLTYPDALIDSQSLSQLPRDVLRVPLLRDVLTEDFVAYYEGNEDRLSVAGALRRLAYEQKLDLAETVLKHVFDEPARVMLWRGPDDKLRYWVLSMQRNGLAKALEAVATVATSDAQLSKVADGLGDSGAPVYALRLSATRSILIASKGDRLIALSEPGMLLDKDGKPISKQANALAALFSDDAGKRNVQGTAYALPAQEPTGHHVVVSANYLSFGYQQYFPGIEALRFDFGSAKDGAGNGWQSAALIDPTRLSAKWDNAGLWRALPSDPAACATLPVDWKAAGTLLKSVAGDAKEISEAAAHVGDAFAGPAAACWYGKSSLVAPLFVAKLSSASQAEAVKPAMAALFGQIVGSYETKAQSDDKSGPYKRLPVTTKQGPANATLWQRPVSARYGTAQSAGAPFAAQLSADRYFPVTLAIAGDVVVFSPDARLVEDALAVLAKRFPAVADSLPKDKTDRIVLTMTPASLAPLVRREAGAALPADQEAVFLNAAQTHLFPKLKALSRYAPVSLALDGGVPSSRGWVPVTWLSSGRGLPAGGDGTPPPADATAAQAPAANAPTTAAAAAASEDNTSTQQ